MTQNDVFTMKQRSVEAPTSTQILPPRVPQELAQPTISKATPATEFVLFQKLPIELRHMIMDYVIPGPRFVPYGKTRTLEEVSNARLEDELDHSILWNFISERIHLPVILQVNKEFRRYGQCKLTKISINTSDLLENEGYVYFNYAIDTLLLRDTFEDAFEHYHTSTGRKLEILGCAADKKQLEGSTELISVSGKDIQDELEDKSQEPPEDIDWITSINKVAYFSQSNEDMEGLVDGLKYWCSTAKSVTLLQFGGSAYYGFRDLQTAIEDFKTEWEEYEEDEDAKELPLSGIRFVDFEANYEPSGESVRDITKFPKVFVNLPYSSEDAPGALQYPSIFSWVGEDNAGPKRSYNYQKSVKEDGLRCYIGMTSEMYEDGHFVEEEDGLRPMTEREIEDDEEQSRMDDYREATGKVLNSYGVWVYPDDTDNEDTDNEETDHEETDIEETDNEETVNEDTDNEDTDGEEDTNV